MSDHAARAERLRREAAQIRRFVARAADGEVLGFEAILPKPEAIIWRLGQATFWRFDTEREAKTFMQLFGTDLYRLATDIQEMTNA